MKIIDYVDIKPTVDTNYHLVTAPAEISGYNCAIVLFTGIPPTQNHANMFTTHVRPTGVSLAHDSSNGTGTNFGLYYVPLDANDQFEISCNNAGTACWIIGGMTDAEANVFTTDYSANDVTPTATGNVAENIDISGYLGGDTALAAIVHVRASSGTQRFGYAGDLVSNTENIYCPLADTQILVPVTSGSIRLARESTEVTCRLVGYIKGGITYNATQSNSIDTNEVWATGTVPDRTTEDIVFMRCGNGGSNKGLVREVGASVPELSITTWSMGQIPLRPDANGEIEYYTDLASRVKAEWFATNDVAASATITDIDGDNNVQVGQTGAIITTTGIDAASVTQSATLGGETITITGWS